MGKGCSAKEKLTIFAACSSYFCIPAYLACENLYFNNEYIPFCQQQEAGQSNF